MGEISVKTGNNARNGGKNSLNRLIRCVCGKKIGPDPRNFNQRVSLGRNDLLIRTFPNVLARHESATDDVRKLLNTIFTEEEPEEPESAPASSTEAGGLDSAHSQLYRSLLEKEQWSRKEATELCGNLNLMLGGALEVINDWSYAVVDAPVLDDADDDIWVDLEIAKELEG